jgi:RNA polymerase sigma-70 factor (ECF subfamily)
MELNDGAVIVESLADPMRFAAIFDRHYDAVFGFVARRVGAVLAADVAAETFARAFAGRRRYRPGVSSSARPWLFGIAVTLLRHHHRTEARRLRAYARTGVDPVLDATPDVERRVDAETVGPRLAEALAALRPAERDVLLLFAWADLSYAEIAEALGLEVGTVRSRLSRARNRVRELLAGDEQEVFETAPTGDANDG